MDTKYIIIHTPTTVPSQRDRAYSMRVCFSLTSPAMCVYVLRVSLRNRDVAEPLAERRECARRTGKFIFVLFS